MPSKLRLVSQKILYIFNIWYAYFAVIFNHFYFLHIINDITCYIFFNLLVFYVSMCMI